MRHIQIAAHHDRLLRIECQKVVTERIVPCHSIVQAAQTVLRVGHISRNEVEIFKFQRHCATFVVMLLNAQAVSHAQGADAREDSRAGIAFLFGIVPITFVALKFEVDLSFLQLRFLQAKAVSVELSKDFFKTFLAASSEAVDVPRYKFHAMIMSCQIRYNANIRFYFRLSCAFKIEMQQIVHFYRRNGG